MRPLTPVRRAQGYYAGANVRPDLIYGARAVKQEKACGILALVEGLLGIKDLSFLSVFLREHGLPVQAVDAVKEGLYSCYSTYPGIICTEKIAERLVVVIQIVDNTLAFL